MHAVSDGSLVTSKIVQIGPPYAFLKIEEYAHISGGQANFIEKKRMLRTINDTPEFGTWY
jgi:hypothetical protein